MIDTNDKPNATSYLSYDPLASDASSARLRLGSRASPLALAQTLEVAEKLAASHANLREKGALAIVPVTTSGDRIKDKPLAEFGGKGLFVKEIEDQLLTGEVDVAVHSMKDVPAILSKDVRIGAILAREDARDAFFSNLGRSLEDLPKGAVIGTSSLRRQSQALLKRPDVKVIPLRGNVTTRLNKLASGDIDATFLAVAGLKRLGKHENIQTILDIEDMLPAAGQGAIGLEVLRSNEEIQALLAPLGDRQSAICLTAERAFLRRLEGTCRTPIAAYAEIVHSNTVMLRALVAHPQGIWHESLCDTANVEDARYLGETLGQMMITKVGPARLAEIRV